MVGDNCLGRFTACEYIYVLHFYAFSACVGRGWLVIIVLAGSLHVHVDQMYREAPIKNTGMFDYVQFTRILKHGAKEKDEA